MTASTRLWRTRCDHGVMAQSNEVGARRAYAGIKRMIAEDEKIGAGCHPVLEYADVTWVEADD